MTADAVVNGLSIPDELARREDRRAQRKSAALNECSGTACAIRKPTSCALRRARAGLQGRAITLLRRGGARWCSRPRSPRPRSPLKACASWSTADLRVPRYEPDLGLTRLETVRVSRAEDFAAQRRATAAATTSAGMRRPMIICSRATDGSSASECQGNGQIRPSNAIRDAWNAGSRPYLEYGLLSSLKNPYHSRQLGSHLENPWLNQYAILANETWPQ
jgi:hypothetical protein